MAARLFEQGTIGVSEEDDWLLHVIDLIVGEVWLIVGNERDDVRTGNVGGGDDREFIPRNAVAVVNGFDETARGGAADRYTV